MSKRLRIALVAGLVAAFGFGAALSTPAAAQHPDCVEDVLDLPALNVCKDADGLHHMKLPAMGVLSEPAPPVEEEPEPTRALPRTGLEAQDFAAIGLAALAGGAVLLRRLRLAVS
jgi:LPXTG-motif cell wall-anchored protein